MTMLDKKMIGWYKEQLERGATKKELVQTLYDKGYSEKDVNELVAIVEKPIQFSEPKSVRKPELKELKKLPELPSVKEKSVEKVEKYKIVEAKRPKKVSFSEFMNRESKTIWKAILALILLILIGTIIFFFLLRSPEGVTVFEFMNPPRIDDIPPKVFISVSQAEWLAADDVDLDCVDSGIDFSSGCDNSSYVFYLSDVQSCPKDYSLYSPSLPGEESGFLCFAAKDAEGNVGFSQPVPVKFDTSSPTNAIEEKSGWFSETFSVNVTDEDSGSGLEKCFYRILSSGDIVVDWTERPCDSTLEIPVGPSDCDNDGVGTCVLEVYAIDSAGNAGEVVSASFDIDLEEEPPCTQGDTELCSSLEGVCSSSIKTCDSSGRWGECMIADAPGYEDTESKCSDGLDNDCDGNIDEDDSDCSGKCSSECSPSGSTTCIGNYSYTCRDGNGDGCVEWTSPQDCSDCSCTCGVYTTGIESEVSCLDGIDNDCDGFCDVGGCGSMGSDSDCEGCALDGSSCLDNMDCCSGKCDNGTCFSCVSCYGGDYCSNQDNQCDVECGADLSCDDMDGNQHILLGTCDFGKLYFMDECYQCFVQDTNNCSSSGSCTADPACNGSNPNDPCGEGICNSSCNCVSGCLLDGTPCAGCDCEPGCCNSCDSTEEECYSCSGVLDHAGICEEGCGASSYCDDVSVGTVSLVDDSYCCDQACAADNDVGSCTCQYGNCDGTPGMCSMGGGGTCYYSVTCELDGWQSPSCEVDVCATHLMIDYTSCASTLGCLGPIYRPCNSTHHDTYACQTDECKGTDYNCTFDGSTWAWRTSNPSEAGNCNDGEDNDCDGDIDANDSDCGDCIEEGGLDCGYDEDCCTGVCDTSKGRCISCTGIDGKYDSIDETCEAACGAGSGCDERSPGGYGASCCTTDCTDDTTAGSCSCLSSTCPNGYCRTSTKCYYPVSCGSSGWQYSQTCDRDECTSTDLITDKMCSTGGCSGGTHHYCNAGNQCTEMDCGGFIYDYKCTTDHGSNWMWYDTFPFPTLPDEDCDDTYDNDCDGLTDCDDTECFFTPPCFP